MRDITNERENIAALQRMLRELHHADTRIPLLAVDGIYGVETTDAVREFQRLFGLPETGRTDYATWNAIHTAYLAALPDNAPPRAVSPFPTERDYVIRAGEYSDIAALVQFMLRELSHHYDGIVGAPPDGVWGDASAQDIRALQRTSALPETGEVDKKTWNALADAYSRAVRERDARQK